MAGTNRDDPQRAPGEAMPRRLERPPSERYRPGASATAGGPGAASGNGSALPGPLARAGVVSLAGAVLLVVVGAILASTAGLLFAAGATGAAIGLVLARAAVPEGGARPVPRRTIAWIAVGLSIAAVAVAAVATWVIAQREGGTLALVAYLVETFGLFSPGETVIAVGAAAWGASAGPIQS